MCAHTGLSVAVAGVEGQTHNLELLTALARSAQCVELVNLVHLGVEEILVGTLRAHLLFPLPFTLQVLCVTLADVRHDVVDRLRDTVLTSTRSSHQHVHQRRLMQHVVDVAELHLIQMCCQGREHGMSHSRLVDVGRSG